MPSASQTIEIEAVLSQIAEAQLRAGHGALELERENAPAHLVTALRRMEAQLGEDYRRLHQATMQAPPSPGSERLPDEAVFV